MFPWAGEAVFFGKPLFDGSETRLVVRECLPEDAGAYTCVAENRAGKTSSSAAVCVRGKTTHTHTHNAEVSSDHWRTTHRSAKLQYATASDDTAGGFILHEHQQHKGLTALQ